LFAISERTSCCWYWWNCWLSLFKFSFILLINHVFQEEFEDTKGVIRIRKDRQHNGQQKKRQRTNNHLQTLHRKLKIEQQESHLKPGVNSGAFSISPNDQVLRQKSSTFISALVIYIWNAWYTVFEFVSHEIGFEPNIVSTITLPN
jgi:hypothetical protein